MEFQKKISVFFHDKNNHQARLTMNQINNNEINYRKEIGSHLIYGFFEIMIVGIIIYILINYKDYYNFEDNLETNF